MGLTWCAVAATVASASAQSVPILTGAERSLMSTVSVVHEYVPASYTPGQAAIPSNLKISSVYHALVEKMLSRSPTFRRQVLRVAGAQQLTVQLRTAPPPWPHGVRAITQFVRNANGQLSASIDITPMNNDVELIAHELEHVIEQLDDVDLSAKAGRPNSGVRATTEGGVLFETTRAARVGIQVSQEVR